MSRAVMNGIFAGVLAVFVLFGLAAFVYHRDMSGLEGAAKILVPLGLWVLALLIGFLEGLRYYAQHKEANDK